MVTKKPKGLGRGLEALLGPTVSAVPSKNTRWARSFSFVLTRSLAWMSMPTRNTRSGSAGGWPRGSPAVTEVTPTLARQGAARLSAAARVSSDTEQDRAMEASVF